MLKPKNVKFINGNKQLYEQFEKHHVIGHGNSFVFQVKNQQGLSQCIKQVILEDKMSQFIFIKQIQLLTKLKNNPHTNIVMFKGSYTLIQKKLQGKSVKKGFIQMQKGITNLKSYLNQRKQSFNQEQIIIFFQSMIDVFAHLQKIQVAHRDIKPSNILLFNQDPLLFKICDVGAGTAVGQCDNTKQRTVIGTPYFLSPQLYQAFMEKKNLTNYKAYKSDVYSLGLLFIQFCLFKKISDRMKNQPAQVKQKIQQIKGKYPNIIGLGKVLRNMLQFQVTKRMDFIQLKHFITQNNLIRNKFNKTITLSQKISEILQSRSEITISSIQDLKQINAIVSSQSSIINSLKIHIQPRVSHLKPQQKQLFYELGKIRHMKLNQLFIDIQVCEIQDQHIKLIADSLEKNSNLNKLNLNFWNNKITNQAFIYLLKSIKKYLLMLQQLKLYFPLNNFKIDETYKEVFNFSNLNFLKLFQLNLGFNNVTSDGLMLIFKDIGQIKSLETLSLIFECIKTNPIHFGKAVKNLLNLSMIQQLKLNFSSNSIRDQGMFALSDLMSKFTQLTKIQIILRSCEIQDKGLTQFTKSLSQCKRLKQLKMNFLSNQLTQKSFKNISPYIENLQNLKTLDLNFSNNSNLNDAAIRVISKSILVIKKINKLRLVFDSIDLTQKGCLYLGRLISQEPLLEDLQLSLKHDDIKLVGIQYICAGLLKVKRIRKLKICIQATNIGDQSANYLAMCLLKMRHLTNVDLNLDNCNLTNESVENIIKTVKQCSKQAEQITINLRRNQQLKLQLYEQIKKDLQGSRIAIKMDNPLLQKTDSTLTMKSTMNIE